MSSEGRCIVDTVVLLYFLLVRQDQLLRDLVGDPIAVPLSVYDPGDRELPEESLRHSELLSEIRQSIRHYEIAVRTSTAVPELLRRARRADALHDEGRLEVVEMSPAERAVAARLQSRDDMAERGLRVPLGAGEAACVAIAHSRSWTIATDDDAALAVMRSLHGRRPYTYERIRKLLVRAAGSERISRSQANEIHAEMRGLGFWDAGMPFP